MLITRMEKFLSSDAIGKIIKIKNEVFDNK